MPFYNYGLKFISQQIHDRGISKNMINNYKLCIDKNKTVELLKLDDLHES